jgi:hypothetical protein
MNFEFSENLCGFQATEGSEISRLKYQNQPALYCQCTESNDQVGTFRNIDLPNQAQYHIKITGQSNNDRTYVKVTSRDGYSLIDEPVYFKRNEQQSLSIKFYGKVTNIRLSILMGGDSIVVRGNSFLIFQIRIIPIINEEKVSSGESFQITRTFETVAQFELERQEPLRSNQTPMEIGEYAILRNISQPRLKYEDLYVLSNTGLKYVSRIGSGRPSIFGEPIHMLPGRDIPIFENENLAQKTLQEHPDQFYSPTNSDQDYHHEPQNPNTANPNDIYIYLDDKGYVRWLRYKPNSIQKINLLDKDI